MTNSVKFSFSDFTLRHYKELLHLAKERSQFISASDVFSDKNGIFWRHDVDFSLENALILSHIERDMGIRSTYYLHLHSEFYNLLEKKHFIHVKDIISSGHEIGLHFDTHYYNIDNEVQLEEWLSYEKALLELIFNTQIRSFSFHNTSSFTMSCEKDKYVDLINVYSKYFKSNLSYCSDSNGYWRHQRLYDFLYNNTNSKLQVLTHPEWWTEEVMSPKERIWKCLELREVSSKSYYIQSLTQNGREIIDW